MKNYSTKTIQEFNEVINQYNIDTQRAKELQLELKTVTDRLASKSALINAITTVLFSLDSTLESNLKGLSGDITVRLSNAFNTELKSRDTQETISLAKNLGEKAKLELDTLTTTVEDNVKFEVVKPAVKKYKK